MSENDITSIICELKKEKERLKEQQSLYNKYKYIDNSDEINNSKKNIEYSLEELTKYYVIKCISSFCSLLSISSYAITKKDELLYSTVFFTTIFLLDKYFYRKEEKALNEEKMLIMIHTFTNSCNKSIRDLIQNERNEVNIKLKKVNNSLEFLNSLTEEEKIKYLNLKMD